MQLFFLIRVAMMGFIAPSSTSFQRSNAYQLLIGKELRWREDWVDYAQISKHMKRAVIASEDASFTDHGGVDWEAIEKAWNKNEKTAKKTLKNTASTKKMPVKLVGGSTMTQQLAKNLFLSGERNLVRKGQELVLTLMLEGLLSKQRIFEIYLNHVEFATGVFGIEAAAQHYFEKSASELQPNEAARLAVLLPRPKTYEKVFHTSAYLQAQAATIEARMAGVDIP